MWVTGEFETHPSSNNTTSCTICTRPRLLHKYRRIQKQAYFKPDKSCIRTSCSPLTGASRIRLTGKRLENIASSIIGHCIWFVISENIDVPALPPG